MKGTLIGCGFFAENHLHAWKDLGVTIVAVCDLDAGKASATAKRHGIERKYTNADAMLKAEAPDFVDVVAPVAAHRRLVEIAAAHSVPVICQKPLSTSLVDADAMVEACIAARVPLMVHENFRWQLPMLAVREAIDAGRVGAPFFGRFSFRHDYDIYVEQPYLANLERFLTLDVGVHLLDLARHFFGEVAALSCTTQSVDPRVRGDDVTTILLQHESGATTIVDASFATHAEPRVFPETTVEIDCTAGAVRLASGYALTVTTDRDSTTRIVAPEPSAWMQRPWHVVQDSVRATQKHWLEVLAGRAKASPSGEDNRRTLELALRAYESAERRETIILGTEPARTRRPTINTTGNSDDEARG